MKRLALVGALVLLVAAAAIAAEGDRSAGPVVNINTATGDQLQLLPRIGPALAERIISFREVNGPFERPDELIAVKGIGEQLLDRLRPYLVTKGETTLKEKVRLARATTAEAAD